MAKKRYYQSAKDRVDESRGMEREIRAKDMNKAYKEGEKSARSRYGMDRGDMDDCIMPDDRSSYANMPQNVVMKEYPNVESPYYNLNDDIRGIDTQIDDDVKQEKKNYKGRYPRKF